ncbi:MAG: STAS domain-containing protein [Candidatus Baltobacteraceae bacterium]
MAVFLSLSDAGYTVVSFSGELDLSDRDRIVEELRLLTDAQAPLVDLSTVTYLDSTVLGALIGLNKAVAVRGKRLSVLVGSDRILKIFSMTKLNQIFDIYESEEAAMHKNVLSIKPHRTP